MSVALLCDLLFFQRYFLFLFGSDFDPSAAPYSLACLRMSAPSQFLAQEKFWANKAECEDAEYRYYAKLHGKVNQTNLYFTVGALFMHRDSFISIRFRQPINYVHLAGCQALDELKNKSNIQICEMARLVCYFIIYLAKNFPKFLTIT